MGTKDDSSSSQIQMEPASGLELPPNTVLYNLVKKKESKMLAALAEKILSQGSHLTASLAGYGDIHL